MLDEYPFDKIVAARFTPNQIAEELKEQAKNGNLVKITSEDNAHVKATVTLNLIVNTDVDELGKRVWEAARSALVEFDGNFNVKQLAGNKLFLNCNGGLK